MQKKVWWYDVPIYQGDIGDGREDIDAAGGWHTRTAMGPPVGMWREPVAGTRVRSES